MSSVDLLNNPPAGTHMAELSRPDRARVAVAVADLGPGIWDSPLCGGDINNVGRYVAEGALGDRMRDRHSFAILWGAAAEYAAAHRDILNRTHGDVREATAERAKEAAMHEKIAVAAFKAGDWATARANLDAGELVHPDYRASGFRTWDDLRAIVARKQAQA